MRRMAGLFLLACACGSATPREPMRMGTAGDVTRAERGDERPAEQDDGVPHAWLWKVFGGRSRAPSYVLGTMHIGVGVRRALPQHLDQHLYHARSVVMEVDPREVDRMLTSARRGPSGRSRGLDHLLPREAWDALVAELGDRVPREVLRRVPGGALGLYLQQVRMAEVEAAEEGRTPVRGATSSTRLDMAIFDWAVRAGRPVVPLETPEEAFAALEAISDGDVIEPLRRLLLEADAARGEARHLRDAYLSFEESRITSLLDAEMPERMRQILLLGRNEAWMPHLLPEIEAGDAFVAVGVAHLLGPGNVLERLAAEGFEVRRVTGLGTPPTDDGPFQLVAP